MDIIKERILGSGGDFLEAVTQRDHYYNHPSRDFSQTDEALRIRFIKKHENREKENYVLTYKSKKLEGLFGKARKEYEVSIKEPLKLKEMLTALGFIEVKVVEKDRYKYNLSETLVCLDNVKGLGWFVEIERMVNIEDPYGYENQIMDVAKTLGLEGHIRKSYLELLLDD